MAQVTGASSTARPASFTLVSSDMLALPAMSATVAQRGGAQRAETIRRHRLTQFEPRSRTAPVERVATADHATQIDAVQASSGVPAKVDLIGDLLKRLGGDQGKG